LLYERQDPDAVALLQALARGAKRPEGRIRALYALAGMKVLTDDVVLAGLNDTDPHVREHAVRNAEALVEGSAVVRNKLVGMVGDENLRVRYQLAFTLGEFNGPRRNAALASLAKQSGEDGAMQLAIRSSLGEGAGAVLEELAADGDFRKSGSGRTWLKALAAQIGRQQRSGDVAAVLKTFRAIPKSEAATITAIVEGLAAKRGSRLEQQVAAATGGQSAKLLGAMLAKARTTAADSKAKPKDRAQAVRLLELGDFGSSRKLLVELLDPVQPNEVQLAALATLGSFDDPGAAQALLGSFSRFSPRLRGEALETIFSRRAWLNALLTAVEKGTFAAHDVDPGRIEFLKNHPDKQLRSRAKKLFASVQVGNRKDVVEAYSGVLGMDGDVGRGKAAFKKVCAACHRLENQGFEIGPNLAAMKNRGAETILVNVLDPSREVDPKFVNYIVLTEDGRSLTGMIASETATSLTLKRPENATDTILRIDINALKSTGKSIMPEGLEKQIDKQTMADLIAYLLSLK
jgi:putative heme-binding domain-containing protein